MERNIEIDRFAEMFRGNVSAYGADDGFAVKRPVSRTIYRNHLTGDDGMGVYPIRMIDGEPHVHWGCCDIDTGDWEEAYRLAFVLQTMGMKPFVERSRSKGWHIWVFVEGWVHARIMRRALKMAYTIINLPAKEANPKQETLAPEQLGNYVRLPYKGGFKHALQKQTIVKNWCQENDGEPCSLPEFMDNYQETDVQVFEKWAAKYFEPPKRQVTIEYGDIQVEQLISALSPSLQKFVRTGPKTDRSAGMVALAHHLRVEGATPSEAAALLCYVDQAWGKNYTARSNGQDFIEDIIQRAYG